VAVILVADCVTIGILKPPIVTLAPKLEKLVPLITTLEPGAALDGDTLTIEGTTERV